MRKVAFQTMTPTGLVIDAVTTEAETLLVSTRAAGTGAACPDYGRLSNRVHSRYHR